MRKIFIKGHFLSTFHLGSTMTRFKLQEKPSVTADIMGYCSFGLISQTGKVRMIIRTLNVGV